MSNKSIIEGIKQEIRVLQEKLKRWESIPEAISIHYSLDREYYYVTDTEQDSPKYWMSVENEKPDSVSDSPFTPSYLQIKRVSTGAEYWKEVLPFNFWKVKSGDVEPLTRDSDLYQDYASLMQWKELAVA